MRAVCGFLMIAAVACVHRSPEDRVLTAFREASLQQPTRPPADSAGAKCTLLKPKVVFVSGDSAIVALRQDCASVASCPTGFSCGMVRFETDYLMTRKDGRWRLEKAVAGGVSATP
jgi:hypothetical protein